MLEPILNFNIMDDKEYDIYQEEKFKVHEAVCMRCGACCGAFDGDPCSNLARQEDGKYFCNDYEHRFEYQQKTIKGIKFHCVPIGDVIKHLGARPNCAYVNK